MRKRTDTTGSYKNRKANRWLMAVSLAAVALACCSGYLAMEYRRLHALEERYDLLLSEQRSKTDQLRILNESVVELQDSLNNVEKTNEQLIQSVGIESMHGVGGLTENMVGNPYKNTLHSKEEELVRDLWLRIHNIKVRNQEQDTINQALRHYLERKAELLTSIPAIRPIHGGWISSGFKIRKDPFTGEVHMHQGLDFAHLRNTPILAAGSGTVVFAGWHGDYGKTICVDHGFGFETRYAHLQSYQVNEGDTVQRGQVIGRLGSTGRATGPHLHYEVRIEGQPVNPYYFIYLLDRS
ncbi:M23 family metallopeptidase [bacterium]|nr:M23 family metallopeptidase [candidate division CSSED10-310 bacterium]